MSSIKPANVKGTRDFLPLQTTKRRYLLGKIISQFKTFGFQEIETPALENLSTLTGKYGEEGDKLLFKILNSGNYTEKVNEAVWNSKEVSKLTNQISEKGLRYDLTVPLARYVVQHQNDLVFPFKRFHIGPVWRADRPQKGRYREFYQCDADIIGSSSLLNEVELTQLFVQFFKNLNVDVKIRVNSRKILEGIVESVGLQAKYQSVVTAIDKIDKIGREGVVKELQTFDISAEAIDKLFQLFSLKSIQELRPVFEKHSATGIAGLEEISSLFSYINDENVVFDSSLARGLDYYTGIIWEVSAEGVQMGTIAAGGRYDNLTGMFSNNPLTGVGISFGVERIFDVMEELSLFPDSLEETTEVLFINFGGESLQLAWQLLNDLRSKGISAEIFPDEGKMKKQLKYADQKKIKFVVIIGEEEMQYSKFTLKNMVSGEQKQLTREEILKFLV
jgi:histidyl-tRNA synthetase